MRSAMLMAAAVALLTGCAATPPPGGQAVDLPFPTFLRGDSAPEALLEGTLTLEDDCLAVADPTGAYSYSVVLPDTSTWDADTQTVTIDRLQLKVGGQVAFGGGFVYATDSVDPDHRCVRGDEVFYVHTVG